MIFWNSFLALYGRLSLRQNLKDSKIEKQEGKLVAFFSMLYYVAFEKANKGKRLLVILILIFVFSFAFSFIYFNILISMVFAILCTSIPVLSLVSKLLKDRNRSSKESIVFLSELFRMYKIENLNIYSAMEKLIKEKDRFPVCAKYVYLLCMRLRESGSREYIKKSCDEFANSLNSSWGKSLALCIECASKGVDISDALMDIQLQLKLSKKSEEERKRLNGESYRMTAFLVPFLYVLGFVAAIKFLNIPFGNLLYNQFLTAEGFLFFAAILLLFCINILLINLITDIRLDI